MVKHFYIKFGDPSCCRGIWDIVQKKNRRTHRKTNAAETLSLDRRRG